MKAQGKAVDFLCIILGIIILGSFFFLIFPKFLDLVVGELVGSSAEVLARQSSGVITLLGAATHNAKLSYEYSKQITYTIQIENRVIRVIPHYTTEFAEKAPYSVTIGIELGTKKIEDTHGIIARKEGSVYKVEKYV
jgi:hypothetical protein